jgi:ubiquinone/menaquinone biosynthesis C-methylase UbiE
VNERDIFFEVHDGLPREAPGDEASTVRALRLMNDLPEQADILDIACGPGGQTVALARHSKARIAAVDLHEPFLAETRRRAEEAGVGDRITTIKASMFEMASNTTFDAIWSEGAIYIIGFEAGLRAWRRFLKPAGYIAVTELSWIRPDPPPQIADYWIEQYAGIAAVENDLRHIKAAGYREVGHFTVPETACWDSYYHPMERRVAQLRAKYVGNDEAQRVLDTELTEIDMYRKYSDWYGYVFYVMQV